MTEEYWESAGFARLYQTILKWQSVVIWVPNQVFEKSESRGEISKEKSPLRFYEPVVTENPVFSGSTVVARSLDRIQIDRLIQASGGSLLPASDRP
jgi:hypothetical protein